ncbi:11338_t:CDS:2, partial [Dentiscutata erythropus]
QATINISIDQATINVSMNQATTDMSIDQVATDKDYEKYSLQLQAAIEKLAKKYGTAKAKSILALTSFLYNMNYDTDLLVYVKSGAKILYKLNL